MSASLIEQLAARLGISPEEAEYSLQTLMARLHEDLRTRGETTIPGLGVFRRATEGLTFEAAPALEIAANYRFAGMPARPVSPEPEEHPGDVEETVKGETGSENEPAGPEEGVAEAEESVADEPDEATEETAETEASDLFEAAAFEVSLEDEEEVWEAPRDEADNPLGPLPEPAFEEADYDVVEETVEEVEIVAETVESSVSEDEAKTEAPEDNDAASIFNVIHFEDDEEVQDIDEPAGERVDAAEPEAEEATEPEVEEEPVPASEKEIETIKRAAMHPPRTSVRRERASRTGFFILIGVLAVLIGAFFAYQMLKPGAEEPETPALSEDMPPVDTSAASALPPADSARAEAPAEPEHPVRRTLGGIDRNAGGWTVIVASETTPKAAEAAAQPYLDLDLPVDVLRGVSKGVTRYRVGVGQFTSQAEAEAAMRRLGDRLPPGAWPLRITSQM